MENLQDLCAKLEKEFPSAIPATMVAAQIAVNHPSVDYREVLSAVKKVRPLHHIPSSEVDVAAVRRRLDWIFSKGVFGDASLLFPEHYEAGEATILKGLMGSAASTYSLADIVAARDALGLVVRKDGLGSMTGAEVFVDGKKRAVKTASIEHVLVRQHYLVDAASLVQGPVDECIAAASFKEFYGLVNGSFGQKHGLASLKNDGPLRDVVAALTPSLAYVLLQKHVLEEQVPEHFAPGNPLLSTLSRLYVESFSHPSLLSLVSLQSSRFELKALKVLDSVVDYVEDDPALHPYLFGFLRWKDHHSYGRLIEQVEKAQILAKHAVEDAVGGIFDLYDLLKRPFSSKDDMLGLQMKVADLGKKHRILVSKGVTAVDEEMRKVARLSSEKIAAFEKEYLSVLAVYEEQQKKLAFFSDLVGNLVPFTGDVIPVGQAYLSLRDDVDGVMLKQPPFREILPLYQESVSLKNGLEKKLLFVKSSLDSTFLGEEKKTLKQLSGIVAYDTDDDQLFDEIKKRVDDLRSVARKVDGSYAGLTGLDAAIKRKDALFKLADEYWSHSGKLLGLSHILIKDDDGIEELSKEYVRLRKVAQTPIPLLEEQELAVVYEQVIAAQKLAVENRDEVKSLLERMVDKRLATIVEEVERIKDFTPTDEQLVADHKKEVVGLQRKVSSYGLSIDLLPMTKDAFSVFDEAFAAKEQYQALEGEYSSLLKEVKASGELPINGIITAYAGLKGKVAKMQLPQEPVARVKPFYERLESVISGVNKVFGSLTDKMRQDADQTYSWLSGPLPESLSEAVKVVNAGVVGAVDAAAIYGLFGDVDRAQECSSLADQKRLLEKPLAQLTQMAKFLQGESKGKTLSALQQQVDDLFAGPKAYEHLAKLDFVENYLQNEFSRIKGYWVLDMLDSFPTEKNHLVDYELRVRKVADDIAGKVSSFAVKTEQEIKALGEQADSLVAKHQNHSKLRYWASGDQGRVERLQQQAASLQGSLQQLQKYAFLKSP